MLLWILGCGLGANGVTHHDDGRLAFDHPSSWTVNASGGEDTSTTTLQGPDDALLMLFVWEPGLAAEPDHMASFLLEMIAADLGPIELATGQAVTSTRTLAGEPAQGRSIPLILSLDDAEVPGTLELALVDTKAHTLATVGLLYEQHRAAQAPSHALVLDSLAWSAK